MTTLAHPGIAAERTPDKPAVIMAETGETLTFREFEALANQLSRVFHGAGLRPGDCVALFMTNVIEYLPSCTAANYAGLRYVPVSSRLSVEELTYLLQDCEARMVVCSADLADVVSALAEQETAVEKVICVDGTFDIGGRIGKAQRLADLVADEDPTPLPDRVQGVAMMYSSGTTGRQKGVHFPMPRQPIGSPIGITAFCRHYFGLGENSIYLSPAPMYHSAPHGFSNVAIGDGATVVVMRRFDAEAFLDAIGRYRVTHTQLVPTFFVRLLKLPEEVRARSDLSTLEVAVHAAAPCPVDVKQRMIEWWGPILREYYGGTERIGLTFCDSEEWLAHPGTVGRAVLGELHICDEDGTELPVGADGLIFFAGKVAFSYHGDEEKTRRSRHPVHEDWATYGDIGHVDEDGYLYLTDRSAFMIISGGVNIYPQEAENVLIGHPKVADAAVFGIPHPEMGEEVKAVVQPADMADAGPDLEAELIAYCRERLAHLKCPRSVDFDPALPRELTGKLHKKVLRDRYR